MVPTAAQLQLNFLSTFLVCEELEGSIEFGSRFRVTALCHPDTYLNKVLIGTSFGTLQLWNTKTRWVFLCHC